MQTISINLKSYQYPIYIGEHLIAAEELLRPYLRGRQAMIVSHPRVAEHYAQKIMAVFSDIQCDITLLPEGEVHKTWHTAAMLFDALLEKGHNRHTTIIALGGGVIGDIAGFAASCYQRGVGFIQVPTTLLSQVDASVGGKTGVNHVLGKNMIGTFYHPSCVLIDIETLKSLDEREFRSGFAEVIKYALIQDAAFFEWLEENFLDLLARKPETLINCIAKCCQIKADIVQKDPTETGIRALLNFGHTFGHAIESATKYSHFLHGEAVSIGMLMAATLSMKLGGGINSEDVLRLKRLLNLANLPTMLPQGLLASSVLLNKMAIDKKNVNQKMRLVLLERLGQAKIIETGFHGLVEEVLIEFMR